MPIAPQEFPMHDCPSFKKGWKVTKDQQVGLWEIINENQEVPSREVMGLAIKKLGKISITIRHLNRLRAKWRMSREKGRPGNREIIATSGIRPATTRMNIGFVGVHILEDWMEHVGGFNCVLELLKTAIESYRAAHPEESFPLLHHREETLLLRFKGLFYAPLFEIKKLTGYDVKEHSLHTVIGRGYQNSTLRQFLDQLERIDAGPGLMPALLPTECGKIGYIDGHMIPFWTRTSMHKGKITMLGRIMAGSQAVVTHAATGEVLYVEYYSPDIRLPRMILNYCEQISILAGIIFFVVDREINSVIMSQEFEGRGWGLLSMLDSNEYKGLSDWDATFEGELPDGRRVYSGKWSVPRKDDKRHFVLVETEDRLLAYWGTSKVKEMLQPLDWPATYAARTEIQENSFKRMIGYAALNVNFGNKKIIGPDRHQERTVKKLEEQLTKVHEKVEKKTVVVTERERKIKESEEKGHTKRLQQRRQGLSAMEKELKDVKNKENKIREKIESLGPPRQRADRDFRKQKIMTFRTFLLENTLTTFISVLMKLLDIKMGMETLMSIFFRRGGLFLETPSEVIYRLNTDGLSSSNKKNLKKISEGLTQMGIHRQGKPIRVELREAPT